MFNTKSMLLVALSVLVSAQALADRKWPDRLFDCQVVTTSGAQGLVSLQSFSLEDAEKGVLGLPTITLLGAKETAARVLQCIERGSGKSFTDPSFQAWFAKLDQ